MKRIALAFGILGTMAMVACGPNRNKEIQQIEQAEASLLGNVASVVMDTTLGAQTIDLYLQFAKDFPNDSLTPEYLYRAADIAFNMGNEQKALDCFNQIIDNHETYRNLGNCYFMLGECYSALGQYQEAKEAYGEFVKLFPDHPLAKDTRYQLEHNMIGLSPEEMLKAVIENAALAEEIL